MDTGRTVLLTVDVEDWASSSLHLLSAREASIVRHHLPDHDMQVDRGVQRLLESLDSNSNHATFFVLVRTARMHKPLIRQIHECGHEIGSHSVNHPALHGLSLRQMENELGDSRKFLEDLIGAPILGFRAPRLDGYPQIAVYRRILESAGYTYDSSFIASRWRRISGHEGPSVFADGKNTELLEFPVTVTRLMLRTVPVGGTYLKLLGTARIARILRRTTYPEMPVTVYLHPYELDRHILRWPHPHPSVRARFATAIRNIGKDRTPRILSYLVRHHRIRSISDWLDVHRQTLSPTAAVFRQPITDNNR